MFTYEQPSDVIRPLRRTDRVRNKRCGLGSDRGQPPRETTLSTVAKARLASLIVAFTAVACLVTAPGAAAAPNKPYSVDLDPVVLSAGATTTVTATISNEATTQSVGSIQFAAPTGVKIISATSPGGNGGLQPIPPDGTTVLWLNQNIEPQTSETYELTVKAPCMAPEVDPWTWQVQAKQSNNFSGPPGNTFGPQSPSTLPVSLSGECQDPELKAPVLTWSAQPADSKVGTPVGTAPFASQAPWPSVLVTRGGMPVANTTVNVALDVFTGLGMLASDSTDTATTGPDGVATFSNLSVVGTTASVTGAGYYRLQASLSGADPVASNQFLVQKDAYPCSASGCSGSSTGVQNAKVTASTSATSGHLSMSVLTGSLPTAPDCAPDPAHAYYEAFSSEYSMVLGPAGAAKSITYEITKSDMNRESNNGAAFIDVCYGEFAPAGVDLTGLQSETIFEPRPIGSTGRTWPNPVTVKNYSLPLEWRPFAWDLDGNGAIDGAVWVLADCKTNGDVAPCEQNASKTGAGAGRVTWLAPASELDPMGKG